jgi:hypothetical protein
VASSGTQVNGKDEEKQMPKASQRRSTLHLGTLLACLSVATFCAWQPVAADDVPSPPPLDETETPAKPEVQTKPQTKSAKPKPIAKVKKEKTPSPTKETSSGAVPLASAYGLTKALVLLGKELGGTWVHSNDLQEEALALEEKLKPELPAIPKDIIDGTASGQATVLNDFLEAHGFSIHVAPMRKGEVGVVMTTELQGKWDGREISQLKYADGKTYPTYQINVTSYDVPGHVMPVLQIYHRDDIKVFVTLHEDELPGLQAAKLAAKLTPTANCRIDKHIHAAALPKVDKNATANIQWLLGMSNNKGDRIMQALAQTILQMNQSGFRAREAVALSGAKDLGLAPANYYHIDRPFLLWATKDGLSYPLFATRVDYNSFKDPGNFLGHK